ncbi:MAG: winged helix-turn-helix domain-containing protein [Candidatus Omnitrophica bacterium]|nr:winged helix-turn-helix domain-containing protein [Candidatus Omnitrophota bacterium]
MITQIGIVAGEIWHYLDEHGEVQMSELQKQLQRSQDLLLMSLGWLAREGHVLITETKDFKVSLRRK